MQSWLDIPRESDFSLHNLPFGIFKTRDRSPRVGVAIGDYVLDLAVLAERDLLPSPGGRGVGGEGELRHALRQSALNDFIALGKPYTRAVRHRVQELLTEKSDSFEGSDFWAHALLKQRDVEMLMPVRVPNYTDFYSSLYHATNVGAMFRDPKNALLPNWRHLPVAYHGRASSIVVSGTPIHRPKGQTRRDDEAAPSFGPTRALDFELEMAFVVGKPSALGESIRTAQAEDHIFGLVLFNDWSARDIQKWEYQPLGPFLAKNFGSAISPWVVTLEALEPFRCETPPQEPQPLPYLQFEGQKSFDIQLEVDLTAPGGATKTLCRSNTRHMYWNMSQQLAHHTVNGCNVEVGDLCASGTLSGPEPESFGSMFELTWGGKNPIHMPDNTQRTYVEDGDTITMRAWAQCDPSSFDNGSGGPGQAVRVGFGEVRTKILPAR